MLFSGNIIYAKCLWKQLWSQTVANSKNVFDLCDTSGIFYPISRPAVVKGKQAFNFDFFKEENFL